MTSTATAARRLDGRKAARFLRVYNACLDAKLDHEDLASAAGLTPPGLTHVIESGGVTTENALRRLENWARMKNVEIPEEPTVLQIVTARTPPPDAAREAPAHRRKSGDREKANSHQQDEFCKLIPELRSKYKVPERDVLRITGYKTMPGVSYAMKHGALLVIFERTKFVRQALLAGTFSLDAAIGEADKRWPLPAEKVKRSLPRKTKKDVAAECAVATSTAEAIEPPAPDADNGSPPPPIASTEALVVTSPDTMDPEATARYSARFQPHALGHHLPALPENLLSRLVAGFAVIEQVGIELARLGDVLTELATDPDMPDTVRRLAGELIQGISVHTLKKIELAGTETAAPPKFS